MTKDPAEPICRVTHFWGSAPYPALRQGGRVAWLFYPCNTSP